jgi:formylglycine-generating enzyme required for sulfatase activity
MQGSWNIQAADVDRLRNAITADAEEISFDVDGVGFQLRRVPAGEFLLGSATNEQGHEPSEAPQRKIRISAPFYLGKYEVTEQQFDVVMGTNFSSDRRGSIPVHHLHYKDAFDFNHKLSKAIGIRVTLPTEAQWEYACRAGSTSRFHSGDSIADLREVAWFSANSRGKVQSVGQKAPNRWGLYDMHGNVSELCLDELPSYAQIPAVDPIGRLPDPEAIVAAAVLPSMGSLRPKGTIVGVLRDSVCLRGGSVRDSADNCRAASRLFTFRPSYNGFRICIEPNRLDLVGDLAREEGTNGE